MTLRPRRSVLFLPASNARAIAKAGSLACDVVALDLEDAVAPEAKADARAAACAALQDKTFGRRETVVRINHLSSPWAATDLATLAPLTPDAILLPKVTDAADIAAPRRVLPDATTIWAMIETPAAILNLAAIAASGTTCLVLGSNDLLKEMRGLSMPGRDNLHTAMSLTVLAARAHGLSAIDGTYNLLEDDAGLAAACAQGRAFGFDGKSLIHPAQIATANRIFAPGPDEIAAARRVIAAFDRPENNGKSVLSLDGRMIERLHADEAARLLALAAAVAP